MAFPGCLVLSGPVDASTQLPRTKMVTLAGIQAPEFSLMDKENPKQEAYGYQTREYLRKMLLGQKVEFSIEHKIKDSNEKVIGSVRFQGKDVSHELLRLGLAKARAGAKGVYEQLESEARQKKLGVWNDSKNATLELTQPKKVPEKQFKGCVVEDVQGLFTFYVYVPELKALVKCTFGDIFMPQATQHMTNLAKWLVGDLLLQREVEITVRGFDEKFQVGGSTTMVDRRTGWTWSRGRWT